MNLPFRAALYGEEPYGAPQLSVPVVLNVNENPYAPAPEVVEEIARRVATAATSLNRYPDRDFHELRAELADYLRVESEVEISPHQVWAANGSNEVMAHLMSAFAGPGRTVATFAPSYSMYAEYARNANSRFVVGERNEDFTINLEKVAALVAAERPSLILLASPNNPTGTALDTDTLVAILTTVNGLGPASEIPASEGAATSPIVVVDEAYAEFRRTGTPSALTLLADHPNLVVTRTMSKAFGAAGLRLGYMVAADEIVRQVTIVRLPYHLSAITQAAALGALAHRKSLMAQVASLRDSRDELARKLSALGLNVAESDANFLFFGHFADRQAVWQALLDRGVLIRATGPDGWLRVSVGTPEENEAFLKALKEVIDE